MRNSNLDNQAPEGWRWAPAWVLAFVALWPAPGYAEGILVLGALAAIFKLLIVRFRGGAQLLSAPAWALTSVLFFAYWLPEAVSAFDAVDPARALREAAVDLRYLPFLWLAAAAVADARGRRITFAGLAIIVGIWTADAIAQAVSGTSPLFFAIDSAKHAISGHGMCTSEAAQAVDRLSGILGPCNLKFGPMLASLSPFGLYYAAKRFGVVGWCVAALSIGAVILLAGARAAWITYALVLLWSGWRVLGVKRVFVVFVAGALTLVALGAFVPQVAERIERTTHLAAADESSVDIALSGRTRIWSAATCMYRTHWFNGVGARGFRDAFMQCDPGRGSLAAWGEGPALHAHQWILEVASETGTFGLLLWLAGLALGWRAWRYADPVARDHARPAMLAIVVTLFPFNTHLAAYSTFWGGLVLLLAALYAGSLLARDAEPEDARA
ncbi:Membrane protein [Lysobacter dokdonensis DS-58]|uniref:Membrane protein n=1 Tax=Lysobacter dokdonensis DS-58 TaxID=1300345 RepID=A0A0A2WZ62_9GAMM|nr:O-antigen ligase family protein [Lysobacter dokdonensis]KGQ18264.1 Membrane protein [Lysobacter dokdonensis DS-58]